MRTAIHASCENKPKNESCVERFLRTKKSHPNSPLLGFKLDLYAIQRKPLNSLI